MLSWHYQTERRTFGQSFHWTDREAVLAQLEPLVRPGGAIAVIGGPAPGSIEPPAWLDVIAEVRARFLGPQRRAGSGTYDHPKASHQDVLARSAFSRVEIVRFDHVVTRTLDDLVGLQFSYSYSSPAQLGEHRQAFEEDLRAELLKFSPDRIYHETVHTEVIIATRPGDATA